MSASITPSRKRAHSSISNPDPAEREASSKKTKTEDSSTRASEEHSAKRDSDTHRVDTPNFLESALLELEEEEAAATTNAAPATSTKSALSDEDTATDNEADAELKRALADIAAMRAENATLKKQVEGHKRKGSAAQSQSKLSDTQKLEAYQKVYGSYESQAKNLKRLADEKNAPKGRMIDESRLLAAKQGKAAPPKAPIEMQQTIQGLQKELATLKDMNKKQVTMLKEKNAALKDFTERFGVANGSELKAFVKAKDQQIATAAAELAEFKKRVKQQDDQINAQNFTQSLHDNVVAARDRDIHDITSERNAATHLYDLTKRELKDAQDKLTKLTAANTDLEKSAEILHKSKASYKHAAAKLEETMKEMKAALKKKDFQLKSIGDRCAKRVSYIAVIKAVLRARGIELPKPVKDMEFSGWDDKKDAKEAVEAFRSGK